MCRCAKPCRGCRYHTRTYAIWRLQRVAGIYLKLISVSPDREILQSRLDAKPPKIDVSTIGTSSWTADQLAIHLPADLKNYSHRTVPGWARSGWKNTNPRASWSSASSISILCLSELLVKLLAMKVTVIYATMVIFPVGAGRRPREPSLRNRFANRRGRIGQSCMKNRRGRIQ